MEINHTIDELLINKKVHLSKFVVKYLLINIYCDDEIYLKQCKKKPINNIDIVIAYMTKDSTLYYCKNIENFYSKRCGIDKYRNIKLIHELFN